MLEIKSSQTEMKGLAFSVEDLRTSYDSLRNAYDYDVMTKEIQVLKEFYQDNVTLKNRGKIISTKGVIKKSYKSKDWPYEKERKDKQWPTNNCLSNANVTNNRRSTHVSRKDKLFFVTGGTSHISLHFCNLLALRSDIVNCVQCEISAHSCYGRIP